MNRLPFLPFLTLVPLAASAQTVFSENFNVDHSANWTYYSSVAGDTASNADRFNSANFSFDYGTVGIPKAPNSTDATTIGLKMQANLPGSTAPTGSGDIRGMSVSPIGLSLTGDYTLQFDSWQNYQANASSGFPATGDGTTQAETAGIGATSVLQFPGSTMTGVGFGATGDGGSSTDYRAWNRSTTQQTTGFAATGTGPQNNSNVYYSGLQGSVPAAQTTYAQTLGLSKQSGTPVAGALGMAWYTWNIVKAGTTVSWSVTGYSYSATTGQYTPNTPLLIATVTGVDFSNPLASNIFLGYYDTTSGISADAYSEQLLFGLIDNVKVTQAVPEPTTFAALGLGALALLRRRRKQG